MKTLIRQIEVGPMQNFSYLAGDAEERKVMIVDPAWEVDKTLKEAAGEGWELTGALLTHGHYDHSNGVQALLKKKNVPVFVHEEDSGFLPFKAESLQKVRGGDRIPCGKAAFEVIHTPGHTKGSVCFGLGEALFTGDTLFVGACGRCDLPGGSAREMTKSLKERLKGLPDSTVVYPGHDYGDTKTSTLGVERQTNFAFR